MPPMFQKIIQYGITMRNICQLPTFKTCEHSRLLINLHFKTPQLQFQSSNSFSILHHSKLLIFWDQYVCSKYHHQTDRIMCNLPVLILIFQFQNLFSHATYHDDVYQSWIHAATHLAIHTSSTSSFLTHAAHWLVAKFINLVLIVIRGTVGS